MKAYQPVPYSYANTELSALYDEIMHAFGFTVLPNWVVYLGSAPHLLQGLWDLLKQHTVKSSLSPLLQELVLFCIAFNRAVPYCIELHASNLLRLTKNLDYNDLADIATGNSQGIIPESYVRSIRIAIDLSMSECESKATEELEKAGFDPIQIMEINGLVALAQVLNTYTIAANLPIDDSIKVSNKWKKPT
jgi:alkylhydroperoxidase family enzyme